MRCPFCHTDNDRVIDTRPAEDGYVVRRRRECNACKRRYTTTERLEQLPLKVVKKSGERQPFERDKIRIGIETALRKRSVTSERVDAMVDAVESAVLETYRSEVTTREIGEKVMAELRKFDEVAYVRFASVYGEFKAVDEFIKQIEDLTKNGGDAK